jgi:hypothetical protein
VPNNFKKSPFINIKPYFLPWNIIFLVC